MDSVESETATKQEPYGPIIAMREWADMVRGSSGVLRLLFVLSAPIWFLFGLVWRMGQVVRQHV